MGKKVRVTKQEALTMFRECVRCTEFNGDIIAKREAWSDFTDGLCKDGLITQKQYDNWSNPY